MVARVSAGGEPGKGAERRNAIDNIARLRVLSALHI
jgi:hypothetical protein